MRKQVVALVMFVSMVFAMPCSAAEVPDCIKTLAKASEVYWDITPSNSKMSSVFSAYNQACKLKIDPMGKELDWLIHNGTPGGRVYACFVAWELDFTAGLKRFGALTNDGAAVSYRSGCIGFTTTVSAIATEFVAKKKYHDFPSSVFLNGTTHGELPKRSRNDKPL